MWYLNNLILIDNNGYQNFPYHPIYVSQINILNNTHSELWIKKWIDDLFQNMIFFIETISPKFVK